MSKTAPDFFNQPVYLLGFFRSEFNFFFKKNEDVVSYRFMPDMKDYVVKEEELQAHLLKVCFPEMEKTVYKLHVP